MTALPWLALPLLAPLFGLLVWLGLILRPTAMWLITFAERLRGSQAKPAK